MKQDLIIITNQTEYNNKICEILRRKHIDVSITDNISELKTGLLLYSPAFILLDFDITEAGSLLDEIAFGRCISQPYIIVAAAYIDGNDRAAMLKRGADYCVDSPINAREVLAVVNSVLRRNTRTYTIEHKELMIDISRRAVTMRGEPVSLTHKEYEVLCFLANHAGSVLTKEEIYRAVWKDSYDPKSTNVSDQISSLRGKLGLSSKDSTYIQTIIGVGYKFGGFIQ